MVLERVLRLYTCLTVGDVNNIQYSDEAYQLRVVDLKAKLPGSSEMVNQEAVSIVETDCEVDFDEPEGYKESEYYQNELRHKEKALAAKALADGANGTDKSSTGEGPLRPVQRAKVVDPEEVAEAKPAFQAFSGVSRRIDGKPISSGTSAKDATSKEESAKAHPDISDRRAAAALAAEARAKAHGTAASITEHKPSTTHHYQPKIGDKYSKLKVATSAFTGPANKLN